MQRLIPRTSFWAFIGQVRFDLQLRAVNLR
jgi:hypothetical protein